MRENWGQMGNRRQGAGAGGEVSCRLDRQNGATAEIWPFIKHPSSLHARYASEKKVGVMVALIKHGLLPAFHKGKA